MPNYYETLGVSCTATPQEIKHAYRSAALTLHPDRGKGVQDGGERFKAIAAAYRVLGDAEERRAYDEHLATLASCSIVQHFGGLDNIPSTFQVVTTRPFSAEAHGELSFSAGTVLTIRYWVPATPGWLYAADHTGKISGWIPRHGYLRVLEAGRLEAVALFRCARCQRANRGQPDTQVRCGSCGQALQVPSTAPLFVATTCVGRCGKLIYCSVGEDARCIACEACAGMVGRERGSPTTGPGG